MVHTSAIALNLQPRRLQPFTSSCMNNVDLKTMQSQENANRHKTQCLESSRIELSFALDEVPPSKIESRPTWT